jgi:thiamine transporter
MEKNIGKTRVLIESAILTAMAFLLSFIKLWSMPLGGSITLVSMLPIIIVGLRHGPVWGLCSGFVYSLLQFLQQPYFLTPFQFLLDYVIAFTGLGLSGFFRGRRYGFQVGTLVGIGVRFLSSFLSGVIFYGIYAADYGFASPYIYSLAYNGGYLLPELVITLIIGTILTRIPQLRLLG